MMQDKIRADLTAAMKARKEPDLTVLRGLVSLFTQELTATKRTPKDFLSDDEVMALIKRSIKQRKDAALQFREGGRDDLAQKEEEEAVVLSDYLPAQASFEEIERCVHTKQAELGIYDVSKAGQLVGATLKMLGGRADGAVVKEIVNRILKSS